MAAVLNPLPLRALAQLSLNPRDLCLQSSKVPSRRFGIVLEQLASLDHGRVELVAFDHAGHNLIAHMEIGLMPNYALRHTGL